MGNIYFKNIENDLLIIAGLRNKMSGVVLTKAGKTKAKISRIKERYVLCINEIMDMDAKDFNLNFSCRNHAFTVNCSITAHRNSINLNEKWLSRYSEAKIFSFHSELYSAVLDCYCRCFFYFEDSQMLYLYFGAKTFVTINVQGHRIVLKQEANYLIVESADYIKSELFSEICYNAMVGIGFISGKFIQNEVYTLQYHDANKTKLLGYEYRKLRPSSFSLYHALTENPFSYKHMLDSSFVEIAYQNKILKYFDNEALSKLVELIYYNPQIQYALVLFNEANGDGLSLLIKNNCFFAVLEVLKKFFYEKFKDFLPKGYSSLGNIEKYQVIFKKLFPLTENECKTLEKRNLYLHGDIKGIEGVEMMELMQKQITLIYRIICTSVGFKGYIIDHYSIRSKSKERPFIAINDGVS